MMAPPLTRESKVPKETKASLETLELQVCRGREECAERRAWMLALSWDRRETLVCLVLWDNPASTASLEYRGILGPKASSANLVLRVTWVNRVPPGWTAHPHLAALARRAKLACRAYQEEMAHQDSRAKLDYQVYLALKAKKEIWGNLDTPDFLRKETRVILDHKDLRAVPVFLEDRVRLASPA